MITESTLDFLKGLKSNNSREWFEAHRSDYQEAYGDFFDTVVRFVKSVSELDPDIAEARIDPKSCIMRIYRDIRFSKDKTPYKTGFFAYLSKGGRKGPLAGYYLHLEPEGASFTGGGLYMPEPSVLEKTRHAIDARYPEWRSIVTSKELLERFPKGVQPSGETKRPPKGYDESNPALEYLRFKGYFTQRFLADTELIASGFIENLADSCKAVKPMVKFLNEALEVL
ncbi:MAG TPA: DUF2461 domain-containing protein [Chlorobaculum sp.]|nr:DUF2461 domain-containing protein [Chlorobaculum sp.]